MKDIYELLNDIDIDTSKYEKMDINMPETTKKRIKNKLSSKIQKDNFKIKSLKTIGKTAGVAILIFGVVGIANPTFAKAITDTIKYFEGSRIYNSEFKRYSKGVDLTTTDNKISIKLNSVVYDGSNLYLAYELDTETPLEYGVKIWSTDITVNGKKINGNEKRKLEGHEFDNDIYSSYDKRIEKNDNKEKYIGTTSWDLTDYKLEDNKGEDINIEWNINNIHGIDGKWSFKFKESKKELMDNSKTFRDLGEISFNDIQRYKIDKFTVNPIESKMEVTQITNKDKLNKYLENNKVSDITTENNFSDNRLILANDEELFALGGSGYGVDNKNGEDLVKSKQIFYGLKTIPTELKIIPVKAKMGPNEAAKFRFIKIKDLKTNMELMEGKDKSIVINSLENKENNLKINISFKGMDIGRRMDLVIVDDKDKYLTAVKNKEFENIKIKQPIDEYTDIKNYNIKGNLDLNFENVNEEDYLMYLDYDNSYSLDMENAKNIKLN
ncbi:protein of unknown function [Clostridium cavendishii DSM 21758]|uniref:DUF4179 domain-containing protein n=1 Tax=Clostridium cavendishii DSM 21758 TaxID=1121302 RepID=A0A1M6EFW8_9CLOT|nr:DUF4179 domain-containing protein [Clostridium cavendishii]SHI84220.1 protein of unknown function [Clostridium cavendishii DSM 21758]